MNLISIIIGVLIIVALVFAIGAMNKGNSPCGGNCSTCVMSEHCEKQEQPKDKKEN